MSIYYSIKDVKSIDEDIEYENEYSDSVFFDSFDVDDVSFFDESSNDIHKDVNEHLTHHELLSEDVPFFDEYTIVLYEKERNELDIWNEILSSIQTKHLHKELDYLNEMLRVVGENGLVDYGVIVSKIFKAVRNHADRLNAGVGFSNPALLQLVRYVPFLSCKKNIDFYLEKDTGYIGVIIPMKKNKKGTINITIMSTSEIYYSYVRKKNGLVKFSGKGYVGDNPNNSDAIMSILKMSDW